MCTYIIKKKRKKTLILTIRTFLSLENPVFDLYMHIHIQRKKLLLISAYALGF